MPTPRPNVRPILIGRGSHSEVFHRPGSEWVLQVFTEHTPLTPERITREYQHLRATYAAMPDLIGPQRLFQPHPHAPLHHCVLAKRHVDVDLDLNLLRLRATDLTHAQTQQLEQFVAITRSQLTMPLTGDVPTTGVPRVPDIIDDHLANLAYDRDGRLKLLDTNELISTARLYDLHHTNTHLDLAHHPTHTKLLTRMLLLETLAGRTTTELHHDPLYLSYLTASQIHTLQPHD